MIVIQFGDCQSHNRHIPPLAMFLWAIEMWTFSSYVMKTKLYCHICGFGYECTFCAAFFPEGIACDSSISLNQSQVFQKKRYLTVDENRCNLFRKNHIGGTMALGRTADNTFSLMTSYRSFRPMVHKYFQNTSHGRKHSFENIKHKQDTGRVEHR
jgi:hypothetical protein